MQAVLLAVCEVTRQCNAIKATARCTTSFYAALVCDILTSSHVDSDTLQLLLPFVLAGVKPSAMRNYHAASVMVIACVADRTALETDFLETLLEDLCKGSSVGALPELLMLMAHIFASQPQLKSLPDRPLKHLVKHTALAAEVAALQRHGVRLDALLSALLDALSATSTAPARCVPISPLVFVFFFPSNPSRTTPECTSEVCEERTTTVVVSFVT